MERGRRHRWKEGKEDIGRGRKRERMRRGKKRRHR